MALSEYFPCLLGFMMTRIAAELLGGNWTGASVPTIEIDLYLLDAGL